MTLLDWLEARRVRTGVDLRDPYTWGLDRTRPEDQRDAKALARAARAALERLGPAGPDRLYDMAEAVREVARARSVLGTEAANSHLNIELTRLLVDYVVDGPGGSGEYHRKGEYAAATWPRRRAEPPPAGGDPAPGTGDAS